MTTQAQKRHKLVEQYRQDVWDLSLQYTGRYNEEYLEKRQLMLKTYISDLLVLESDDEILGKIAIIMASRDSEE